MSSQYDFSPSLDWRSSEELNWKARMLAPWMCLHSIDGLGPVKINTLVRSYGNPRKVLDSSVNNLSKVRGISSRLAKTIESAWSPMTWTTMAEEFLYFAQKRNAGISIPGTPFYPQILSESLHAPPYLYFRHKIDPEFFASSRTVAVVGSRHPSPYAARMTAFIARHLAKNYCVVVSGMARGVDQIAHFQCLEAGGATFAFLGSGVDLEDPRHVFVREKIVGGGAVFSTVPLGLNANPARLMIRNSYIVAASQAVVLIQAGVKGGSMDSAKKAIRMGKPLFALEPQDWNNQRDLKTFAGNVSLIESGHAEPLHMNKSKGWDKILSPLS